MHFSSSGKSEYLEYLKRHEYIGQYEFNINKKTQRNIIMYCSTVRLLNLIFGCLYTKSISLCNYLFVILESGAGFQSPDCKVV